MVRVVVAEDDLLVREGVVALLGAQPDVEVVASVAEGTSLVEAVARHHPDVVLTDIRMPPSHTDEGIVAAMQLANEYPDVGVVVLSQYDDPQYAVRLLGDGSAGRGYLLKERVTDVDHLMHAVRIVASGGSHLDPKVVDRLVAGTGHTTSLLRWLTDRESEVLSEMAQGKDNKTIAESLSINTRSVEKHINSIFAKLGLTESSGVSKRVAAVLTYLRDSI